MKQQNESILVVGDLSPSEFSAARNFLRNEVSAVEVPDVAAALNHIADPCCSPLAVVLVEARPGTLNHSSLDQLRRSAPLARYIGLLGSWCEGEARSGDPWDGMIRTYWHQWLARWAAELKQVEAGDLRWWGLPDTATDDERTIQAAEAHWAKVEGLIGVCSRSFDAADMLSNACSARGYSAVWMDPRHPAHLHGAVAILWDGTAETDDLAELERFCVQYGEIPVIALLDFPRTADVDRILQGGVTAVVSKPLRLDDMFRQVESSIGAKREGASVSRKIIV